METTTSADFFSFGNDLSRGEYIRTIRQNACSNIEGMVHTLESYIGGLAPKLCSDVLIWCMIRSASHYD